MGLAATTLGGSSLAGAIPAPGKTVGDPVFVTVAGVRVPRLGEGLIRISSSLGATASARFEVRDVTGTWTASPGDDIGIFHLGEKLFGGTIESIDTEYPEGKIDGIYRVSSITAVDYNQLARRRLVTEGYPRQLAGDIVRDLAKYLIPEGVTIELVEDAFDIGDLVFEDVYVADALDRIAKLTGYDWHIDKDRRLCFFARESNLAPWTITPAKYNYAEFKCTQTRRQYRNVHRVRGGEDLGEPRTNRFVGDGETTSFSVDDSIGAKPEIVLDPGGVPQTVGIRGLDDDEDEEGFDWFWRKTENTVSQNRSAAALSSAQTLSVTYRPLLPIVAEHRDQAAISERQGVEGGTGIYEAVSKENQIEDSEVAVSLAESEIRRHGQIVCELRVAVYRVGLRVGHLQRVTLPAFGLDDDFLVTDLTLSERSRGEWQTVYTASLSGFDGGWPEYFKRVAASNLDYGADTGRIATPFAQVASNFTLEDDGQAAEGDSLGAYTDDPYTVALVGLGVVGTRYQDENGVYHSNASEIGEVPNP